MVAEQSALSFAGLVRRLRAEAGLTQEELAEAAGLPARTLSDLERGVTRTAHKDTAALLADALGLAGAAHAVFIASARGRADAAQVLAARHQAAAAGLAAATRALPRDIASFTGRQAELSRLVAALTAAVASGGAIGIHVVDGMAGVGKTTFAVHAAHQLTGTFPDGQFFLPLHAHTPGQAPIDPADALGSLLLAAGVPAAQIPP
jgi:transcriptional regulator with XRE-family HTH domain